MKSMRAQQLLDSIDLAINNIRGFQNVSSLEESYLAKFLVVFICGIYEECIETIINEKIATCNLQEASNFIARSLDRYFRNPSVKRIKILLSEFNRNWKRHIQSLPLRSRNALDSIIDNKNNLAHGNTTTITLSQIITYYNDSRIIIETIDNIVL